MQGVVSTSTPMAVRDRSTDSSFEEFQKTYLIVYLLAVTGDWLQGPYSYVLYVAYGLSKHEIEQLYIAGFTSSLIFGTVIGSFADRFGRKNNCILYGFVYAASCVTKHFDNFWVLLIGRVLAGIATSILHSAFESWAIKEHTKGGFEKATLSTLFSHAYVGNCILAIASGVVSQYAVNHISLVAPYDIAICFFIVMVSFLLTTWTENYGDVPESSSFGNFRSSLYTIVTNKKVFLLGIAQSLFESALYCFVLEWTPSLIFTDEISSDSSKPSRYQNDLPHGYIFTSFMMAMMIGSGIFQVMGKVYAPENFMRVVLGISAFSLSLPIIFHEHQSCVLAAFLLFEMCVGIFHPSFAIMRGKYIIEERRATIMNIFRVPLNLIVAVMLSQNVAIKTIFAGCVLFLMVSAMATQQLYKISSTMRS